MSSFRLPVLLLLVHLRCLSGATIAVTTQSLQGEPIVAEIHLYQSGTTKDLWLANRVQQVSGIWPGYYDITVTARGFRSFHRELELIGERLDVRVILTPTGETEGLLTLTGRVENSKQPEALWVLLFPLSGQPSDMTESPIGKQGGFQLQTVHSGQYLLSVVAGETALFTKSVHIGRRNQAVVIDLSGKAREGRER
jgi:hypothetical protein